VGNGKLFKKPRLLIWESSPEIDGTGSDCGRDKRFRETDLAEKGSSEASPSVSAHGGGGGKGGGYEREGRRETASCHVPKRKVSGGIEAKRDFLGIKQAAKKTVIALGDGGAQKKRKKKDKRCLRGQLKTTGVDLAQGGH